MLRALAWALPVLGVFAIAFLAVGWYARNTYYVGIDRGRLATFKGIEGGLLGWDPTVERRYRDLPAQLTEAQREDVKDGKKFSSRSEADAYVARLKQGIEKRTPATTIPVPPEATVPPITAPPPS